MERAPVLHRGHGRVCGRTAGHSTRTDAFHPVPQDTRVRGDTAPRAPPVGDSVSLLHRRRVPHPAIAGCRRCGATGEPRVGLAFATTLPSPRQPEEGRPLHGRRGPGAQPSGPADSPPPAAAAAARGPGFTSAVRARRSRQRSSAGPLLAP